MCKLKIKSFKPKQNHTSFLTKILCVFLGIIVMTACESPEVKVDILQQVTSPNGLYVAYVFEKNSGATSKFIYRLTILKKDEKFNVSNGNTYYSYNKFDVEWSDNTTLMVNNSSSKDIFMQNEKVGDITVKYAYLKD